MQKPNPVGFIIFQIFVVLIGIGVCYLAISRLIAINNFNNRAVTTDGDVVSFSNDQHTINIRFQDKNGPYRQTTFDLWQGCRNGNAYDPKIGDQLKLNYDSANPNIVKMPYFYTQKSGWFCDPFMPDFEPGLLIMLAAGIAIILGVLFSSRIKISRNFTKQQQIKS